ncbi:MAG: hypothetical protein K8R58_11340 [Bacteroidales bacterium]|nr:hypothetical protein [Bacteroidales bacterium]
MDLTGVSITLIVFGFVFGVVYILVRKKERQALINKGIDASIFYYENKTSSSLKWGLFMIGIAVGILLGNILVATTSLEEEVAYFSMIFIFGGLSLVINHFIGKKQEEENKEKRND